MAAVPTFTPRYFFGQAAFTAGNSPRSAVAGDFNEDGAVDLAIANRCGSDPSCHSAGSVSILLRWPNGTFRPRVDYPTGLTPASPITGDFNKDGHLDLAVVNQGDNTVSILLGNGDGTFQNERVYATGPQGQVVMLIAADFNRDGRLDLAVLLRAGISILLGHGDGTFATHIDYALTPPQFHWSAIAAADFDGDGKLDLVAADFYSEPADGVVSDTISVLRGNGDGTFQKHVDQQFSTGLSFDNMIARDLNKDGKPDLVITQSCDAHCSPEPGAVAVFLGNGDGTFTHFGGAGTGVFPGDIETGDFNRDGNLDLAVSNAGDSTITILLGKGDGTFPTRADYGARFESGTKAVGDFNGDGNLDLAFVVSLDWCPCGLNAVIIVPGNGDGTFQGRVDYKIGSNPSSVILPDLNGDKKLDLAVTSSDNTVAILLGNGGGRFNNPVKYATGMNPVSVRAADFNLDGKTDLATVNSTDNTVSVLLGNGDGTLQHHVDYPAGSNPVALSARDLNGDGRPDLAVVNKNGNTVSILIGKGDGTFLHQVTYPTGKAPDSIFVADFNGDGTLDLAIANFTGNTVSILLGNGNGSFKPHIDYATAVAPVAVVAQDLNRDGKLDLAVGTLAGGVSVLMGNGNGTFQTHVDLSPSTRVQALAIRDFNNDGSPDLAVADYGVSILLNKGNGLFQAPVEFNIGGEVGDSYSPDVVAGDVDGDGTPDLVVANSSNSSPLLGFVSVFRNPPVIGLYPGHLSFGNQVIGTSSGTRTVLLSNPSVPVLSLGKISITGANAGDFSLTNSCAAKVTGGTSCQIQVTFTPKAAGARTAALTIADNAGPKPQTIKLTGSGVQ
jgi:hypothetical protein